MLAALGREWLSLHPSSGVPCRSRLLSYLLHPTQDRQRSVFRSPAYPEVCWPAYCKPLLPFDSLHGPFFLSLSREQFWVSGSTRWISDATQVLGTEEDPSVLFRSELSSFWFLYLSLGWPCAWAPYHLLPLPTVALAPAQQVSSVMLAKLWESGKPFLFQALGTAKLAVRQWLRHGLSNVYFETQRGKTVTTRREDMLNNISKCFLHTNSLTTYNLPRYFHLHERFDCIIPTRDKTRGPSSRGAWRALKYRNVSLLVPKLFFFFHVLELWLGRMIND
jgi:hypothetical protein